MYTVHLKATTKITKQRDRANNPSKEWKWNRKKFSSNPKESRKTGRENKGQDKFFFKKRQDYRLQTNDISNYIKCKWSKTPIKRQILSNWKKKSKIQTPYYLQEMHFNIKTQIGLKEKDGQRYTMLTDKGYFRAKISIWYKESHFIMKNVYFINRT